MDLCRRRAGLWFQALPHAPLKAVWVVYDPALRVDLHGGALFQGISRPTRLAIRSRATASREGAPHLAHIVGGYLALRAHDRHHADPGIGPLLPGSSNVAVLVGNLQRVCGWQRRPKPSGPGPEYRVATTSSKNDQKVISYKVTTCTIRVSDNLFMIARLGRSSVGRMALVGPANLGLQQPALRAALAGEGDIRLKRQPAGHQRGTQMPGRQNRAWPRIGPSSPSHTRGHCLRSVRCRSNY